MSSGNPVLDRRLSYAEALLAEGDAAAAAGLMADTLTEAPDWVGGWFRYGEMAEAAGQMAEAVAAYDRVLDLDPRDMFGATLKRDLLRPVPVAESIPAAFVEALFDEYAPRFESSLVDKLGYRGPKELLAVLGDRHFGRALDLGCGTGLMGEALRGRVSVLEGCDISDGMLRIAAEKGIYDRLEKRDLGAMPDPGPTYDLIVAADVFIYLGALEEITGWVARALRPGGTYAFTVEACDAPGFALQDSRRFAHSAEYLADLLSVAGFSRVALTPVTLRRDRDLPLDFFVVTATGLPRPLAREGEAELIA